MLGVPLLGTPSMRPFQSAYIGRHDFPKGLGEFELRQWFTFDVRDRRSIRRAFRSRHWIGAALQLGFIAMTGTTLDSLEYVPTVLLRHLGRHFVQKGHPTWRLCGRCTGAARRYTCINDGPLSSSNCASLTRALRGACRYTSANARKELCRGRGLSRSRGSGCIGFAWRYPAIA